MSQNTQLARTNDAANTFKNLLAQAQDKIKEIVPSHLTPERLIKVAMMACQKTPKLLECTKESFLLSVMQCAELGLEPSGTLGGVYLIPYGNTCQMILGYRGMIALARRSGEVRNIIAVPVFKGEEYVATRTNGEVTVHHIQNPDASSEPDNLRGVYVIANLTEGGIQFDYMSKADIEKIRKRSKSANNGPWVTDYVEMSKKTVIRRIFKMLPMSVELVETAIDRDDRTEYGQAFEDMQRRTNEAVSKLNQLIDAKAPTQRQIPHEPTVQRTPPKGMEPTTGELKDAGNDTFEDPPESNNENSGGDDNNTDQSNDTNDQKSDGQSDQPPPKGDVSTWESFYQTAESIAASKVQPAVFQRAIKTSLIHIALSGKGEKTTIEWREKMIEAIRADKLDWETGRILA